MMKIKEAAISTLLLWSFFILTSCSDYQKSFTFTGTVEKILNEDEILVMKEYGGEEKGRGNGNIYEIPVNAPEDYSVDEVLEVTVFKNDDEDVWDLERMKFEVNKFKDYYQLKH